MSILVVDRIFLIDDPNITTKVSTSLLELHQTHVWVTQAHVRLAMKTPSAVVVVAAALVWASEGRLGVFLID